MPSSLFSALLQVLDKFRGEFLRQISRFLAQNIYRILNHEKCNQVYKFERMIGYSLQDVDLDSSEIAENCHLENR
jgi:hypothetical protein